MDSFVLWWRGWRVRYVPKVRHGIWQTTKRNEPDGATVNFQNLTTRRLRYLEQHTPPAPVHNLEGRKQEPEMARALCSTASLGFSYG